MALALKKAQSKTAPREALAALDARIAELEQRGRDLLAEQLKLEAAGVVPSPPGQSAATRKLDVARLLDDGVVAEISGSAEVRLFEIMRERETIAAAIDLGRRREFRLRLENAAELAADIHTAWHANIAKSAKLLRELQSLGAERARLRNEYSLRVGGGVNPDTVLIGGFYFDQMINSTINGVRPAEHALRAAENLETSSR